MKQELIGPTATLAAAILARYRPLDAMLEDDVITSAFEHAHRVLRKGIARVDAEAQRPPMKVSPDAIRDA
jgi:hypothetical protein